MGIGDVVEERIRGGSPLNCKYLLFLAETKDQARYILLEAWEREIKNMCSVVRSGRC